MEKATITPDQALAAINAVIAQDTFVVTSLAIFLAVVGAIGVASMIAFARGAAMKVTDRYLHSQAGLEFVRSAIRDEVKKQIEEKIVVVVRPDSPQTQSSGFPQSPIAGD